MYKRQRLEIVAHLFREGIQQFWPFAQSKQRVQVVHKQILDPLTRFRRFVKGMLGFL